MEEGGGRGIGMTERDFHFRGVLNSQFPTLHRSRVIYRRRKAGTPLGFVRGRR